MVRNLIVVCYLNNNILSRDFLKSFLVDLTGYSIDYLFVTNELSEPQMSILDSFCKELTGKGSIVYRDDNNKKYVELGQEKHIIENIMEFQILYKAVSSVKHYDCSIFIKAPELQSIAPMLNDILSKEKNLICIYSDDKTNGAMKSICVLWKNILELYLPLDKKTFKNNMLIILAAVIKLFSVGYININTREYIEDHKFKSFLVSEFIDLLEKTEKEVMRQWIKYDEFQKVVSSQKKALQSRNIELFNKLVEDKNKVVNEISAIQLVSNQLCNSLNDFFDRVDSNQEYDPAMISKEFDLYIEEKSKKLNMMFEGIRKQSELIASTEQDINRMISQLRQ